ncbi:MAG: TonB-dependent receptor [Proteobacteria bacterium]|nr:TonB-dependent receptor [Pseudomonadota bacterium]
MSKTKEARSMSAIRIQAAVRVALATTLCVSAATGVYAADAVPAEDSSASGALAEVVVTSQRREESLSKVPISITAITSQDIDSKGIKDITDVARFTPGISVDTTGTDNIAIRGIASSGGSGTTGIYIDDTPIQMRGLAFNPDEALPKAFDIERVEVLRGPQGTLFGAGSEGGTVRYITTQPSLTKTSVYSRNEVSYTTHGDPSFETGIAAGTPLIDGKLGVRATVWYRRDGGWIDRLDPTAADPQNAVVDRNANHADNVMIRLAASWAPADNWTVTPSVFYQRRDQHDTNEYWPLYSNPSSDKYVSANPTGRPTPDKFYLPALKIQGDFGAFQLISNTSYYHREEISGYDGTLYNLGFYQTFGVQDGVPYPLLDSTGIHLPADIANYRSPATVANDQQNFTQEIRLQSSDPSSKLLWTGGLFFSSNRQQYLEEIHDPQLEAFSQSVFGVGYLDEFTFTDTDGNTVSVPYDPRYPNDSYFLHTHARDKQYAAFGEATYALTDSLKVTAGIRFSRTEFSFDSETGGPQLFAPNQESHPANKENSFTPKLNVSYQIDPGNMVYATYAKGFRPGGGNNPLPQAACAEDFQNFGITKSPDSYESDSVHSFEVGSKNSVGGRLRLATSLYYIRWNNIQQTVVPPICQISFITNLGKALAWGGDVQVEWQATDALSAELTAGYTDARFTRNASFGSTQGGYGTDGVTPILPIVNRGNAIVGQSGQPGAPVTVSVGAEYKFSVAQHDSFVRFDYEYAGRNHWTSPRQDPNSGQFNAANYTLSATNFASLRAGVKVDAWSIEPFIDNLFDTHTVTNYDFTIDPGVPGSAPLQRQFTFRPRTYGVTATYRY